MLLDGLGGHDHAARAAHDLAHLREIRTDPLVGADVLDCLPELLGRHVVAGVPQYGRLWEERSNVEIVWKFSQFGRIDPTSPMVIARCQRVPHFHAPAEEFEAVVENGFE